MVSNSRQFELMKSERMLLLSSPKTSANGQLSHWKRAAFVLSKPIVKNGDLAVRRFCRTTLI
ncbi:Uncharacterised protein [Vibrio cholerae]|nr:Uncharacterised protein [Vibrio cholerae]